LQVFPSCNDVILTSFTFLLHLLNKHTIIDMFCSKWTFHLISHLMVYLQCDIALRNPFSKINLQ
jgi:hypothetical protein